MLFAFGLDDDAHIFVDQGKPRSAADVLQIEYGDWTATKDIVAIVRAIISLPKGGHMRAIPPYEIMTFIEKNREDIRAITSVTNCKILNAATLAAVLYVYIETKNLMILDFLRQLVTGEKMEKGMPCYALKKVIEKTKKHGMWNRVFLFNRTREAIEKHLAGKQLFHFTK